MYEFEGVFTREIEGFVHHELLAVADVAEVLLALAYGYDLPTLVEHLPDDLLAGVLRQTSHKHRFTSGGAFPCRRGGRSGKTKRETLSSIQWGH